MRELGTPLHRNIPAVYAGPAPVREHGRVLVGRGETGKAEGIHGEPRVSFGSFEANPDLGYADFSSSLPPVFSGKTERTEE